MSSSIKTGIQILQEEGISPLAVKSYQKFSIPFWNTITSRYPIGTNVFEYDWDLLVILDTCRIDALRELSEHRPWLNTVSQNRSVGSMSAEWVLKTFTNKYFDKIGKTAFISGNIWSHRIFNERFHQEDNHNYTAIKRGWPEWDAVTSDAFAHYETVSAVANQNDRLHPENEAVPHILTDRTISVSRQNDFDRLIVHYTLPHLTFIADALDWKPGDLSIHELMEGPEPVRELYPEEKSYEPARRGDISAERVRKLYISNLQLALDYVEILLQNVDADDVIISSDHGEGLGESGVWAHPYGCPLTSVKNVPWAPTTATDEKTYKSKYDELDRLPDRNEREEILKAMGYL